jgi:Uma2 family endonuclease
MSPDERRRIVESLPSWAVDGEMAPPEGDPHRSAKFGVFDTLREHFRQIRRRIYLAADMMVYYPATPRFAPDFMAVTDVGDHERNSWIVDQEGKGLDFALEIHVAGDARKDLERNVPFYAGLGIQEYFIYDYGRQRLTGYRLREDRPRTYRLLVPQSGYYSSDVLGLQLRLEDGRIRFYSGSALVLEPSELLERANALVQRLEKRAEQREAEFLSQVEDAAKLAAESARRAEEETRRAEEEKRRAEEETRRAEEEKRRAEAAERRAAELAAELERLKRGR